MTKKEIRKEIERCIYSCMGSEKFRKCVVSKKLDKNDGPLIWAGITRYNFKKADNCVIGDDEFIFMLDNSDGKTVGEFTCDTDNKAATVTKVVNFIYNYIK